MNKYGKNDFSRLKVKSESEVAQGTEIRVVKLDTSAAPVVQQFNFGKLARAGEGS